MNPGRYRTSYGLCSILKGSKKVYFICFEKSGAIIDLPFDDSKYTFYSELPQKDFQSVFPTVFKKSDCYLITQLMKRNWETHSNTPFVSISSFLYNLISVCANVDVITKVLQSAHKINWGFINSEGNTYLHKACMHPQSESFMKKLISRMNNFNPGLINQRSNKGMAPLAVLTQKILRDSLSNSLRSTLTHLLDGGAQILICNETNTIRHPVIEQFTVGYFRERPSQEKLVIWFDIYKSSFTTNYSIYALVSNPNKIHITSTDKLFNCSNELIKLKEEFKNILSLNCPQILDYIFSPQNNLLKKSDKLKNGDSLLHIAAQYCNSELLFLHFVKDVTNWFLKNSSGNNVLHSCLLNKQYRNFGILLDKIPPSDFNVLLFSTNLRNTTPLKIMLRDPAAKECLKLVITKGCHDNEDNNIAQIAIIYKDMNLLRLILETTPETSIFTYKNKKGLNSLQFAVENREKEAVELLVDFNDRSILTSQDNTGRNVLHTSLLNYNNDIFKLILGAVVKFDQNCPGNAKLINSNIQINNRSLTPFLLSIQKKIWDATQLLVSNGARIDLIDDFSQSYLYYIQSFCKTKAEIKTVLTLKIDQRNYPNLTDKTKEIQDLDYEDSPLVFYFYTHAQGETFLEFCDAFSLKNIIKPNRDGNTLLHLALTNDNDWLIIYFLNLFALQKEHALHNELIYFINRKTNQNVTALFISVQKAKIDTVKRLLDIGASIEIEYPGGNNILHTAITAQNEEIIKILLRHPNIEQVYFKANEHDEIPIISLMKTGGIGAIDAINKDKSASFRGPNGESILHLVVKSGNKDTLEAILKVPSVKSYINLRDNEGQTPLHYAVIYTKIYAILLLMQEGLKISEPDRIKKTPILYAIDGKNVEVWKAIMGILSEPRLRDLIDQKGPSGLTLLQYSIESNFGVAVEDLLTLRPNLCPGHPEKNSIIHLAAKSPEKAEILDYLLKYIGNEHLSIEKLNFLLHSHNNEQLPPLHYAIYKNNIEGVRILLKQGMSIAALFKGEVSFFSGKLGDKLILCNKGSTKPNYFFGYRIMDKSETAFILTDINSFQSNEIFQEKVTKIISITENTVPLFIQTSCSDVINYLIQHKIIDLKSTFLSGKTLLHYAAQYGSQHILFYLIDTHKLSPLALDTQKNSLLYYAIQNANLEVLEKVCDLLDKNRKPKDLFEIPNSEGKRILEICLESKNVEGFRTILPYISDLTYSMVKIYIRMTLIHLIIQNAQSEHFISLFIDRLLIQYDPRKLCEYANITSTNDRLTALHCSIQSNNESVVSSVLRLNPSLSITTAKGYNALHLAVFINNISILKLLLSHIEKDKSSEYNLVNSLTTDKHKLTPLHISVCNGSYDILLLLLLNSAKPDIVNANGQNALHYAVIYPNILEATLILIINTLLKYPGLLSKQDNSGQTPVFCSIVCGNIIALEMFLEHSTEIDFSHTDKNGKGLLQLSIECKNQEIWRTIFNYLEKNNRFSELAKSSIFDLTGSIMLCMESSNEMGFTNLLGLNPQIPILESSWRELIKSAIINTGNTFYLTDIIVHLKTIRPNDWRETYFYPIALNFTPPLILAIKLRNIDAIERMLTEHISLSFPCANNQLTLYSHDDPSSLVIRKEMKNPGSLLVGYKIDTSVYILVDLPQLDNTKLYQSQEITLIRTLNRENIITILRSPCIEIINSLLLPTPPYTLQLDGGCGLIHLAAQYGSWVVMEHWLFKQNLSQLDGNNNSILFYALLHQTSNIFQTVCDHMVGMRSYELFNSQNIFENRILDTCIEINDYASFSLLLDSKYNVSLDYVDTEGYTLFHKLILLRKDVKFFITLHSIFLSNQQYANIIGRPAGPSNLTPLHLAIVEHLYNYVVFMLKNGYDLCVKSKCGNLPLHLAILYNFDEANLNLILNAIPKDQLSNCLNEQNNQGYTPLHLATQKGNTIIVKILLSKEGIRTELVDSTHRTTLHLAILLREDELDIELIHLLLHDTHLHKFKDDKGRTPVHYCIVQNNLRALEEVFNLKKDIDINEKDNEGKSIFHFAIENKVTIIWNRIFQELKAYSDPKSIIEETLNNQTLLVYCIIHNNTTAFKDILSLIPNIDTFDSEHNTPLHHACKSTEQSELLILLKDYIEKYHKERTREIFCCQNIDTFTPLHYAIENCNVSAIRTLLQTKSPFVFLNKQHKLTLCALKSPLSLKLCEHKRNNTLMIGYKVVQKSKITIWILTKIPDMSSDAIEYEESEIIEITKLNINTLQTVLKCPCAEPLIAFFNSKLISKDAQINFGSIHLSLLHLAAMHGSLEVVAELCNIMDVFSPDSNGDSVLFYAIKNPSPSILEFLINRIIKLSRNKPPGIDLLNATNKSGKRLLEVALDMNKHDAFIVLLKIEFKIELTYKNAKGYTLLLKIVNDHREAKYLTSLLSEIGRREPNNLCTYVNYPTPVNLNTALHLCISENQEECLKSLINFSPNIACEDFEGNSPLHLALIRNYQSLIKILIDHVKGTDGDFPSFINAVNQQKLTPLHYSIIHFDSDNAKQLLTNGANLYAVNNSGQSLLHLAVEIQKIETRREAIKFLLDYERENPNPENSLIRVQNHSGYTPLHLAVIRNKIGAAQLLLSESPDLTITDKDQMTVLHHSIHKTHSEILKKITEVIKKNTENTTDPLHVLNLRDKDGNTAINLAINAGLETTITILLELNPLLNLRDNNGETSLHLAVMKKVHILDQILHKIKSFFPTEMPSYLNASNEEGLPPLHFAILKNRLESVQKLIEFGATLSYTNEKGFTTLYNGKGELSLCFSKAKKGWFDSIKSILAKDTLFVGYRMIPKGIWIVTSLPELTETIIIGNLEVEEYTKIIPDSGISNIVECPCTEPIQVAIQKNLVDCERNEWIGKGKWLYNLASKKGHKNVSRYLCGNLAIESLCAMVKSGVTNNDTFGDTLDFIPRHHNYQAILKLTESSDEEEKMIHNISITLCETMCLSLDNETTDALVKLLSLNPCLNYLYPDGNSTLLHLMIMKNKPSDFLELFLKKIIEIEPDNHEVCTVNGVRIIDSKNESSLSALSLCIQMKQEQNIKTILEYKPDLRLCDELNNSILHFAAKTSDVVILLLIIDGILASPDLKYLFNAPNSNGCIPLHLATETGHIAICEQLLANECEFYSRDLTLRSILHHAVLIENEAERIAMINFILTHPTNDKDTNNIVELEDAQGQLPIHYAVTNKCLASLEVLISHTSTIKNKDVNGQTILHLASLHGNSIISRILTEILKQEENNPNSEWVSNRVINYQDKCNKTPLHLCIDNLNHAGLTKLLTADPNLELVDMTGNTLLHTSVEVVNDTRYLELILIKIPEDLLSSYFTRLNSLELPPLQYAILKNNFLAAEILVKKGASLAFHSDGKTHICGDNGKLKLEIVPYKGQCWAGFRIKSPNNEYLVITDLPDLKRTIILKYGEASSIKHCKSLSIQNITQISQCQSCDPLNIAIQMNLITADTKLSDGLHIAQVIAKHGTKEVVKRFYEIHKGTLYLEKFGQSMIESAVENPNIESLELLLSFLPPSLHSTEPQSQEISSCVQKSLELSLKNPNTNALNALLKHSTKINYLYPPDKLTLLHLAVQQERSTDLLNAIFTKVKAEGTESAFEDVLFINKQSETSKQTALHISIQFKKKDTFDVLLANSPDVFICDVDGNTAVHFAVLRTKDLKFVETLHEFTQDKQKLLNIRNNRGHTALHLAVIGENLDIVKFLLKSNAEFYPQEINEPTLLHLAIRIEDDSIRGNIIEALLPYTKHESTQCEMTQLKDDQGYPPLHLAVRLRTKNAVKLLLSADPSVLKLKDGAGQTPLHISLITQKVENGNSIPYCKVTFDEVLGVIMSCTGVEICSSCQVNQVICTQDNLKRTAMHYAIQYHNVEALKTLLAKKTCLGIPDNEGNILMHEAVKINVDIQCLVLVTEELELRCGDDVFLRCFKL